MSGRGKGGKAKQKTKPKCNSCERYELVPTWGHTLCSYHRKCSGKDFWEPTNCVDCRRQKGNLKKMSGEDKSIFFENMYIMLEQTKKNVKDKIKIDWKYEESLNNFLNKFEVPAQKIDSSLTAKEKTQNRPDSRESVRSILENEAMRQRINMDIERENIDAYDTMHTGCPKFRVQKRPEGESSKNQSNRRNEEDEYDQDILDLDYENNLDENSYEGDNENHQEDDRFNDENGHDRDEYYADEYYENEYYEEDEYDDQQYVPRNKDREAGESKNRRNCNQKIPRIGINEQRQLLSSRGELPKEEVRFDKTQLLHWIQFNPMIHVRKTRDKMEYWTNEGVCTMTVKYNTENSKEFISLGRTKEEKASPFIDSRTGNATILSTFNKAMSDSDLGAKMNGIISHIEQGMGLALTLDILKKHEHLMTEVAMDLKDP